MMITTIKYVIKCQDKGYISCQPLRVAHPHNSKVNGSLDNLLIINIHTGCGASRGDIEGVINGRNPIQQVASLFWCGRLVGVEDAVIVAAPYGFVVVVDSRH